MSVINSIPLIAAGDDGYQISRSVRLRSSASAYFNRTPASAGNRKTWTWSGWVKRGALGQSHGLLAATSGTPISFGFDSSDKFFITISGVGVGTSTAVFRDPSAWYHVVIGFDTTQGPTADRVNIYINNVKQTLSNTLVSLNTDYEINNNTAQQMGTTSVSGSTTYFDGYITEIHFVNGAVLNPSSFGETDSITGVWKPKKYTGTYGTNGFYLNFSDNSSNTATTIGKDNSGNGNNWTPNNISVTSGVTYDSMIDVPTLYADGGNGRGNYAVVNPLSKGTSQTSVINGNLYAIPISGGSNWGTVFSSIAIPTSGKWYMEATAQVYAGSGNSSSFGVVDATAFIPTNTAILYTFSTGEGFDGILAHLFSDYVSPISDGTQGTNVTGLTGTSINLMLALDVDNGKVYAGYNGTWLNSGNPAGNTGEIATRTFSANDVVAGHTAWNGTNDQSQYYNFGQRPFAYTPPTGFKALNTQNLPEPTIKKGNQYFDVSLWTGNGSSQAIVNSGAMQPDLVWVKGRSVAYNNYLEDSVRGAGKDLSSNSTDAEATYSLLSSFNSNGFTVYTNGTYLASNQSGTTYVGWQWKAGGTAVSNTAGSITSSVSANTTAGFSVVTYTGTGANATVGHGLGVAPAMVIVKNRNSSGYNWVVWHKSLPSGLYYLNLNLTSAQDSSASVWNSTVPSSTVFSIGTSPPMNTNGNTQVAYLFAEVAGFSKFGSYTGNGSADGPFVFCGFRPRFVMIKRTDTTADWQMYDTARGTVNVVTTTLAANLSSAESNFASGYDIDLLSNGFKPRSGPSNAINTSGGSYIYMAFAESPFKTSLAR